MIMKPFFSAYRRNELKPYRGPADNWWGSASIWPM